MKRLFCLALALCLAVVLTACGQDPSNASPDNALTELFRQEGVTWAGCTGETAAAFDLEDGQLTIVAVTCDVQADGSESYGRRQQRTGAAWDDQVLCTLYRDSELPGLIFAWQVAEETSGETCLDLTLRYDPGNGTFPLKEGQTLRLYPMQFPDADKIPAAPPHRGPRRRRPERIAEAVPGQRYCGDLDGQRPGPHPGKSRRFGGSGGHTGLYRQRRPG